MASTKGGKERAGSVVAEVARLLQPETTIPQSSMKMTLFHMAIETHSGDLE